VAGRDGIDTVAAEAAGSALLAIGASINSPLMGDLFVVQG
jgi:hypothetical protein